MNQFTSPQSRYAIKYCDQIIKHLRSNTDWHQSIEEGKKAHNDNYVNTFHIYFGSIGELDGSFKIQLLSMKEMEKMYPGRIHLLPEKGSNKYLYIFNCCDALAPGTALTADTIVSMH